MAVWFVMEQIMVDRYGNSDYKSSASGRKCNAMVQLLTFIYFHYPWF